MSNKKERIAMLVKTKEDLHGIGCDAENQAPEMIKENMRILEKRIEKILKLDGVGFISADSKVE
jgi:hypothetical protein